MTLHLLLRLLACLALAVPVAVVAATPDEIANEASHAQRAGDDVRARALAQQAIDAGSVHGLYVMAWLVFNGRGGPADVPRAMELYRQAEAKGSLHAVNDLAWIHRKGAPGVPRDLDRSLALYEQNVAKGFAPAAETLGNMYLNGEDVPRDTGKGLEWLRRAGEMGSASAMNNYGHHVYNGIGIAQDKLAGIAAFRKAAEAGDAQAMMNMAWVSEHSDAIPRNVLAARLWMARAARLGHPGGIEWLPKTPMPATATGRFFDDYDQGMYLLNHKNDKAGAFQKFLAAAEEGLPPAFSFVIDAYANGGLGQTRDVAKGREWAHVAALLGHDYGRTVLADLMQRGEGGPLDPEGARYWREQSALGGNSLSMFLLAQMYEKGEQVPRNDALAMYWYRQAHARGSAKAEAVLKARGLLQPSPEAQAHIERIHRQGPDSSSTEAFSLDVAIYCKYGGPRCHELSVQARQREKQHNDATAAANLQRIWNVYTREPESDAARRARSECMQKKTESIHRSTYGQQDWKYVGDCN